MHLLIALPISPELSKLWHEESRFCVQGVDLINVLNPQECCSMREQYKNYPPPPKKRKMLADGLVLRWTMQ